MGDVLWKMSAAGRMGPLWGVTRPGAGSVTRPRRVESQGLFLDRETGSYVLMVFSNPSNK